MAQSLKNLSFAAIASTICDYHIPNTLQRQSAEYASLIRSLAQNIQKWRLSETLKSELILIVAEFGQRKLRKNFTNYVWAWGLRTRDLHNRRIKEISRNFFSEPSIWIKAPRYLRELFPEEHHQKTVIKIFVTFLMSNFCDNPKAIRDCWSDSRFVHCQQILLDNFMNLWDWISSSLVDSIHTEPTTDVGRNIDPEDTKVIRQILIDQRFSPIYRDHPINNEILPWFMFEVLDNEQRNKIVSLKETLFLTEPWNESIFAEFFLHWPWQNEGFDTFFASQRELSSKEIDSLSSVLGIKRYGGERIIQQLGFLPCDISLYQKLQEFIKFQYSLKTQK